MDEVNGVGVRRAGVRSSVGVDECFTATERVTATSTTTMINSNERFCFILKLCLASRQASFRSFDK